MRPFQIIHEEHSITRGTRQAGPSFPKATASEASQYKRHSVASGYWGDIPATDQPIRRPEFAEAQQRFLAGMLDTPLERGQRNPWDWAISVIIHAAILATVLILPLMFTDVIDVHNLQVTLLEVPRPPAPPPAPAPPVVQKEPRAPLRNLSVSHLKAPVAIPKQIVIAKDEAAPAIDQGVVGGIPGGVPGGILGGILGGSGNGPAPPPPAPVAAKPQPEIVRVGGDVRPPELLVHVDPVYPRIALNAHMQGVVVVDAVIDTDGNVVQAHVLKGPVLLRQSALDAVMQWKYKPTLLNGQPVSLDMEVEVVYSIRSGTE